MAYRLLGTLAGILVLAVLLSPNAVTAKGPTYLLTGGELGPHAYLLDSFIPSADGTDWVTGMRSEWVEPPLQPPSLGYDLYRRYGVFAIPYQTAVLGPEMRYYPELGLVQSLWSQRWSKPSAEAIGYVDRAIADALVQMESGALDDNPFVADLRSRRMHEVNYSLFPYLPGSVDIRGLDGPDAMRLDCDACLGLIPNAETFVFEHLVETVGHTRMPDSTIEPAYTIEFHGWFGDGGGIGGILGLYTLPTDGRPGQFWIDSSPDDEGGPSYQTTAGFDAAIEAALASSGSAAASAPEATGQSARLWTWLAVGIAIALLLCAGMVRVLVRRRG